MIIARQKQINYDLIIAICFFSIYLIIHYSLLTYSKDYRPSFLDETVTLFITPFAFLYLQYQRSWVPFLAIIGYGIVLFLGAMIYSNTGVYQPYAVILTTLLDCKLIIMTFAFAFIFDMIGNKNVIKIFETLFMVIIIICLINIPFILRDLLMSGGFSIKGDALSMKGNFIQPHGLFCHHTEVAWSNSLGAFGAATRFKLRGKIFDIMLCVLFSLMVCLSISSKELLGCFIGLLIILRSPQSGFRSIWIGFVVLTGIIFLVSFTPLGITISDHIGIFFGSNAIENVRAGMLDASLKIVVNNFPIGTGGGTFGSAAASQYGNYSQVYYDYGIFVLYGGAPDLILFLQDMGWAKIIGEGGILGTIFYIIFLISCGMYNFYSNKNETSVDIIFRRFFIALIILVFLISIASSPFTDEFWIFVTSLSFAFGMTHKKYFNVN